MRKLKYAKILTKEFLINNYIQLGKTVPKISEETNITPTTIERYLKNYKIPMINKMSRKTIEKRTKTMKRLFKEGKIRIWNKGLTKETDKRIKKISENLKGYKHSEENKEKQSKTMKRLFKEGKLTPPMLGKKFSKEHRKILSELRKGIKFSKETRKKMSDARKGKVVISKEHRKILSELMKGNTYWKGRKHTEETKKKMSFNSKPMIREKHPKYNSKINELKNEIIQRYKKGYASNEIAKEFNVSTDLILKRLAYWKVEIRNKLIYGVKKGGYIADDGHKVKSSAELFIDNFLFHNRIEHIYEKPLGYGRYRSDFYICKANLYLEYFGLKGTEDYDKKIKNKLELYKRLGLNLLSLYPSDNIPKKLSFLLEFSNIQRKIIDYDLPKNMVIITKK